EKEKINELKGEIKRLKELNPLGLEDQITNLKKQIEGIKKYGLGEISNGIDTRYNIKGYDNFSKEITSQMTGQKVILQSHHGGGTSSAVIKNEVCHITSEDQGAKENWKDLNKTVDSSTAYSRDYGTFALPSTGKNYIDISFWPSVGEGVIELQILDAKTGYPFITIKGGNADNKDIYSHESKRLIDSEIRSIQVLIIPYRTLKREENTESNETFYDIDIKVTNETPANESDRMKHISVQKVEKAKRAKK
ncbi:hypothetical protein, partial [Flammeovirga sp. SJP92]|uniref:hypothetical protein n=1 Tax=Flammeovirga sp. SJP92 TaxID=1775430 RepID=UPI001561ABC7